MRLATTLHIDPDVGFAALVAAARQRVGGDVAAAEALDELAREHPRTLDSDERRRHGVWYTPVTIADIVADRAGDPASRVVDPACGCGALLLAVARRERRLGRDPRRLEWHARDRDAVAARIARARVAIALAGDAREAAAIDADLAATITTGDGLALPTTGPATTVVMNPPFGGAVRGRTGRAAAETARLRARWPLAATGAFDRCAPFVAWAAEHVAHGGRVGMILPRSWLAAPAGARLRASIDGGDGIATIDDIGDGFDDAAVPVVVVGLPGAGDRLTVSGRRGTARSLPRPTDGAWGPLVSPWATTVDALRDAPRLDTVCTIAASATTAEAYDLKPHVRDGGDGFRLITSGAIEPLSHAWGQRTQRYLGANLLRPVVPAEAAPPRRAAAWRRRRVLIPGLAPLLEAVVVDGRHAGAVATLAITRHDEGPPVERLAAVLTSTLARLAYRGLWGAQALGGGSTPITRARLGALRLPPALLAPRRLEAIDPALVEALRLGAAACAWDPLKVPEVRLLRAIARTAERHVARVEVLDALLLDAPPAIALAATDIVTAGVAPAVWDALIRDASAAQAIDDSAE